MNKRVFCITLCLALCIALIGCKKQPQADSSYASVTESNTEKLPSTSFDENDSSKPAENSSVAKPEGSEAQSAASPSGQAVTKPAEPEKERAEQVTRVYPVNDRFSAPQRLTGSFFDEKTWMNIPYSLYLPDDYDSSAKYPTIIFLHGAGERGSDNSSHLIALNNMYREMGDIVRGAIVYCPQCPSEGWWNIHAYDYENGDAAGSLSAALRGFETIRNSYGVDSERIYIMGYSMGGFGTWSALEWHSEMFAAGVPMCGWGNAGAGNILKNIPIWIHHGTADTTVGISSSEEMYNAIKNAGGKLINFTRLQGVGHNAWDYALADREMFSWLFAQSKSSPKTEYDYIPYFKVVSPSGDTVITERDVQYLYSEFSFTENDDTAKSIKLCLTDAGLEKLKKNYKANKGKTFSVFFGQEKLFEYKVKSEPTDEFFYIDGVFNYGNSESFERIINKSR